MIILGCELKFFNDDKRGGIINGADITDYVFELRQRLDEESGIYVGRYQGPAVYAYLNETNNNGEVRLDEVDQFAGIVCQGYWMRRLNMPKKKRLIRSCKGCYYETPDEYEN